MCWHSTRRSMRCPRSTRGSVGSWSCDSSRGSRSTKQRKRSACRQRQWSANGLWQRPGSIGNCRRTRDAGRRPLASKELYGIEYLGLMERRSMRYIQFLVLAGAMLAGTGQVQAQPAPSPKFEVASVKPNVDGPGKMQTATRPGGVFLAVNTPLRLLIADAYIGNQPGAIDRIVGGPEWVQSARYDITAKAAREFRPTPPGPPAEMLLMLRSLLEDRFKLKVHREPRELPAYELVVIRPGAAGLRKSDVDCDALFAAGQVTRPEPGVRPRCGITNGPVGPGDGIGLIAGAFSMSQFAQFLQQRLGRPVIDKTGLTGRYDFDLAFAPIGPPPTAGVAADPSRPTIFIALEEQLGIRLQSTNG